MALREKESQASRGPLSGWALYEQPQERRLVGGSHLVLEAS